MVASALIVLLVARLWGHDLKENEYQPGVNRTFCISRGTNPIESEDHLGYNHITPPGIGMP